MASLKAYRTRAGKGVLFGIYVTPEGVAAAGGGAGVARVRVGDLVESSV